MPAYSMSDRSQFEECDAPRSNRTLFETFEKEVELENRAPVVLLTGGRDLTSLALRRSQSVQRFDAEASSWSHAAVVLDWKGGFESAFGLEVSLGSNDAVPERNGVTLFDLSDYVSARRFPNLALVHIEGKDFLPKITKAVANPNRDRIRFPLFRHLGVWKNYIHNEGFVENPLLHGIGIPSAAFVEYAFQHAGYDLFPSATESATTPEMLYSSLRYWLDRLSEGSTKLRVWSVQRDRECERRERDSYSLEDEVKKRAPDIFAIMTSKKKKRSTRRKKS